MSKWITYLGEYDKTWYDVKTVDGKIHEHCWPNSMDFYADLYVIHCAEVSEIRLSQRISKADNQTKESRNAKKNQGELRG